MKFLKKRRFTLKRYEELESTNTTLKESADKTTPWFTIRAIRQTAGRGRFKRVWYSEPGKDLTFSTSIPVQTPLQQYLPNITQIVAISVAQALESLDVKPQIKWPNDILVEGKKICGILVEGVYTGDTQILIAGIGININSLTSRFGETPSTSLLQLTQSEHDPEEILQSIVDKLIDNIEQLSQRGFQHFKSYYEKRLAYKGEHKLISIGESRSSALIKGITSEGALIIERDTQKEELISGEILFQ